MAAQSFAALLFVFAGFAGATACRTDPQSRHSEDPEPHVWTDMFADIRAARWPEAHGKMVDLYRDRHTVAELRRAIEENPLLSAHTSAETNYHGSCDGMNRGLCAGGSLTTSIGRVAFDVSYAREAGAERIIAISVGGVPVAGVGVPTPPAKSAN